MKNIHDLQRLLHDHLGVKKVSTVMPPKHYRYARPSIEIEYDRAALSTINCCGFVPVVLRVCGIDEHARLMVTFERARKPQANQNDPNYEVHPLTSHFLAHMPEYRKDYREYHAEFLARAHSKETGSIHIQLESAAYSILVDAWFFFDRRKESPMFTLTKGRLQTLRFLPHLRSTEERNALHGAYPTSVTKALPGQDHAFKTQDCTMFPLFSLDG